PEHLGEDVAPGISPGTWVTGTPLAPGESYTVTSYSPRPSGAELATGRGAYPSHDLADELTIALPTHQLQVGGRYEIHFPAFHSGDPIANVVGPVGVSGASLINASPYARAYALASQLARRAATRYAFVLAVERFLSPADGFAYAENPPRSRYPLES